MSPRHDDAITSIPAPSARRLVARALRPLERYMRVEASSGIVLVAVALTALAWASSPWGASYERLWETPILGAASLRLVINDALMVVFFFVVGLEIRRELHEGELSEVRRAALPLVAALGGMVVPAVLYATLNSASVLDGGPAARRGWGVPMATDIAFALGVVTLLGRRVPAGLRVMLLALAIIDDIGAIVVIAIFYAGGIHWSGILVALAAVGSVVVMQRRGVRRPAAYVPSGIMLWGGMLHAGVHPAIAGVILGLLTPAREGEAGEAAPVVTLVAALEKWVAYGVMPIFALANAGVRLTDVSLGGETAPVTIGVVAGLTLGKPAGILLATFTAARLRLVVLPRRVTWKGVGVVGVVAGIGFTMAIFIAGLAFPDRAYLHSAKAGVLAASALAAVAALVFGRIALPLPRAERSAGD